MTPVVLFVFNRPDTTERVLAAIRAQTRMPDKLIVFADGARDLHDEQSVRVVRDLIRSIDWTDVQLMERERNLGCAQNILRSLGEVFHSHERATILEDDVLPVAHWYESMLLLLDRYAAEDKVFSVGSYPSIKADALQTYPFDVILSPRFSCWGWASWADRWLNIINEFSDFRNPFIKPENVPLYAGYDLPGMARVVDDDPSQYWDIPIALLCLHRGLLHALTRYYLVSNIGIDSGTHGKAGPRVRMFMEQNNRIYEKVPQRFPSAVAAREVFEAVQLYVGEISVAHMVDSRNVAPSMSLIHSLNILKKRWLEVRGRRNERSA